MAGEGFHPAWPGVGRACTVAWCLISHLASPCGSWETTHSALILQWALQTGPRRGNFSSLLHPPPPCGPGDILLMVPPIPTPSFCFPECALSSPKPGSAHPLSCVGSLPCLTQCLQNEVTSAPSACHFRLHWLRPALPGSVTIGKAEQQPLGLRSRWLLVRVPPGVLLNQGCSPPPRVWRKKVYFEMEDQCFSVYFLMGGWEGLFKMGQATPPFRASISPSVNCRYDY